MKSWTLTVLGATALLGACATGRDGRTEEPLRALLSVDALLFAGFDADDDLRVTTAEIEAGVTREFARADTNQDGSLTPLEFGGWSTLALGGAQTPPYRLDFDRNVDNTITAEEFRTEITSRANDYDVDRDGALTRAEFVRDLRATRMLRDAPPDARRMERRERQP